MKRTLNKITDEEKFQNQYSMSLPSIMVLQILSLLLSSMLVAVPKVIFLQ